ncbi:hypothetical protein ACBG90_22015 [Stutzerimonas kunmingensis]|uniref:hypothetical protein n=1 Tax=Stutzerimonas kunmingensis TaxID=1211807 RepID=UPI003526650A
MKKFSHLVKIEEDKQLLILRVYEGGKEELYTTIELPDPSDEEELNNFFRLLGENIILDSPIARALLGL